MAFTGPKRSLSYTYTNLHTNSAYMLGGPPNLYESGKIGDERYKTLIQNAIDKLKSKEDAFAQKFGYDNCDILLAELQKLFKGDFASDLEVLRRFESDNLRRALHKEFDNKTIMLEGKKVRLILDSAKTTEDLLKIKQELEKAFNIEFGNRDFKIIMKADHTAQLDIGIEWDIPKVKRVVNAVQGTHFVYNTVGKKGQDNTSRAYADYRLVEHLKNNAGAMIKVKNGSKAKYSVYEFRESPLAYRGKELPNMSDDEINKFGQAINNFIFNVLAQGASSYMRDAISRVWNQVMTDSKLGTVFFMGGKGWINHLIGALGEFVTPVFFYYCVKRLGRGPQRNFLELVGQKYNRFGEQRSIDIEIDFLKAAGIQVKNYNGAFVKDAAHQDTSKQRTITVNLHPSDIASLAHDERVVPYIVNSYFNTSIRQIPETILQHFFEYHAYDFLNLAIDDSLIEDRATFYLVGGYLIPGSAILNAAFVEQSIKVSNTTMRLKGEASQGNDAFYRELGFTTPHGHTGPNFLEYWSGNMYVGWSPTNNNSLTKYESNILIKTSFTYSALFKAEYKMF